LASNLSTPLPQKDLFSNKGKNDKKQKSIWNCESPSQEKENISSNLNSYKTNNKGLFSSNQEGFSSFSNFSKFSNLSNF
jgi:hypothetical protein